MPLADGTLVATREAPDATQCGAGKIVVFVGDDAVGAERLYFRQRLRGLTPGARCRQTFFEKPVGDSRSIRRRDPPAYRAGMPGQVLSIGYKTGAEAPVLSCARLQSAEILAATQAEERQQCQTGATE